MHLGTQLTLITMLVFYSSPFTHHLSFFVRESKIKSKDKIKNYYNILTEISDVIWFETIWISIHTLDKPNMTISTQTVTININKI
jgi:hypothetical protein